MVRLKGFNISLGLFIILACFLCFVLTMNLRGSIGLPDDNTNYNLGSIYSLDDVHYMYHNYYVNDSTSFFDRIIDIFESISNFGEDRYWVIKLNGNINSPLTYVATILLLPFNMIINIYNLIVSIVNALIGSRLVPTFESTYDSIKNWWSTWLNSYIRSPIT